MENSDNEDFSAYDGIPPTYNHQTLREKLSEVLNLQGNGKKKLSKVKNLQGNEKKKLSEVLNLQLNEKMIQEYTDLLVLSLSSIDIAELKSFVNHLLDDEVPLAVSKPLLIRFVEEVMQLDLESGTEIAHFTLAKIRMNWINDFFQEQAAIILRESFPL